MTMDEPISREKLDELVSRLEVLHELAAGAREDVMRIILTSVMVARVRPESRNYKRPHPLNPKIRRHR